MKKMKKRILSLTAAVLMLTALQIPAAAMRAPANSDLFILQGTDISDTSTSFTVKIFMSKEVKMNAYTVTLGYDKDVLSISGEGTGYKYCDRFGNEYRDAVKDLNHVSGDALLIFAGANANATTCSYEGDFAQVTFQIKDKSKIKNNVLTNLALTVTSLTLDGTKQDVSDMAVSYNVVVNSVKPGDVDGNNSVNLTDANMTLKIALGIFTPTDKERQAADVDKNNTVNLLDANLILKVALGIRTL